MQHSYNITNLTARGGVAFRAAVNAALQALASNNLGASAAATPYEGMLQWFDEGTTWTLKAYTGVEGYEWTDTILSVDTSTGEVTGQNLVLTLLALTTGFSISGGTTSKTLTVDTDVTASNLMLKTGPNLAIGSDADGDTYYYDSGLARLAAGAANFKKFMNAAGTAPEWASGIKVITATRDLSAASGDVSYSGVDFKPSAMIAMAGVDASTTISHGFIAGTIDANMAWNYSAASAWNVNNACVILAYVSSAYQMAVLKTWDTDGFTLTWTKSGSPTGTLNMSFLCLR